MCQCILRVVPRAEVRPHVYLERRVGVASLICCRLIMGGGLGWYFAAGGGHLDMIGGVQSDIGLCLAGTTFQY